MAVALKLRRFSSDEFNPWILPWVPLPSLREAIVSRLSELGTGARRDVSPRLYSAFLVRLEIFAKVWVSDID